MPKISVVIPTYNRPEYLQGAIASVLNQTFQDFEIIVIDDASSTDYVPDIISGFNDQRIRYTRHQLNRGLSAARNRGIMVSRGKYIALLDDDDEWLPEKLELQYDMLKCGARKIGIIYTGCIYIDRKTNRIYKQINPSKRGDLSQELMKYDCITAGGSSVLLKKECFHRVGYFDENIPSWEAYEMWIRLSRFYHFDYISDILVKYYHHDIRMSMNYMKLAGGIEMVLKKYKNYFSQDRKSYSSHYFNLALLYCLDRDMKRGRELILKSIRLYPFFLNYYFCFMLSYIGSNKFKQVVRIKEILTTALRDYKHIWNETLS